MFYKALSNFKILKNKSLDDKAYYSQMAVRCIRFGFGTQVRLRFYEQIAALLESGLSLYDALRLVRKKCQERNDLKKGIKRFFKSNAIEIRVLNELLARMDKGMGVKSIAELFKGLVPDNELVLLAVDSRQAIKAFHQISNFILQFSSLRSDIKKMMATPILAIIILLALIFTVNAFVFPQLLGLMGIDQLPEVTQNLYYFCHAIGAHFEVFIVSLIVISCLIVLSFSRFTSSFRTVLDYVPPWSIYKQIQGSSFLISLSLLLDCGKDFNTATQSLGTYASRYFNRFIERAYQSMEQGDRPGKTLTHINLFNADTSLYIEILDEAEVLSKGLSRMAKRSVDIQINSIKKIMRTLSFILLGSVLCFMVWFYVGLGSMGTGMTSTDSINTTTQHISQ